jgi:flavin-dependent dehydrogenase
MRVAVIGGGPAGLSLAYFLKGYRKFETVIYEGLNSLGEKPCAWGLLRGIENLVPLSKDVIISKIKKFKIYLDNKLITEYSSSHELGYIIDKPLFLSKLAEGLDIKYNSRVICKNNTCFSNNKKIDFDKIIFANGHYSLSSSDTIPAIQYISDFNQDPEVVEFYFFSNLLGYGWIFPDREGSKIGIGGWASIEYLKALLNSFVKGRISKFHGAKVADTGIIETRFNSEKYIGEALGTVYAITGEGIRPSIISAKIMADSLIYNKSFSSEFKKSKLFWALKIHANIIKTAKSVKDGPRKLSEILLRADPELVLKLAMGDFDISDLIKLFGKVFVNAILLR